MDRAGWEEVLEGIRANPYDPGLLARYYDLCGKPAQGAGKQESDEAQNREKEYRILKFLNDPVDWQSLNSLGRLSANQGKYFLASMCFLESLRIHPRQPEIFHECEQYRNSSAPEYLNGEPAVETLVSVIMGTYNRTREIRESIQSVLDQTFPDFELLVVNDGGTDEVEHVVRSFRSPKIRYCKLDRNRGHAAALNEGIRRSRGKRIAYLDDDDVYYPDHLETLVQAIRSSGKKFVYSNTRFVRGDVEGGRFAPKKEMYCWNVKHDRNRLIRDNYISNLGVIHEKGIFSDIGLFSEDLNAVMDWEFWLRASLKYPFHHLDRTTGEYRFSGKNITSRNRLLIDFHTNLIRSHYTYYRGLLALTRFHLARGEAGSATARYQDVKSSYDDYFRTGSSAMELADLAIHFRDDAFLDKITRDFFAIDARGCLKYVNKMKSARMWCAIVPSMPNKICEALRNRFQRSA